MLGISDYWAFIAAVLVFLALPGPGTFALLHATAKGGFRAGAAATFGLIGGDQVLMWLAAIGVAAVVKLTGLTAVGRGDRFADHEDILGASTFAGVHDSFLIDRRDDAWRAALGPR